MQKKIKSRHEDNAKKEKNIYRKMLEAKAKDQAI